MGSRRRVLQQTLAWPTSWVGLPLTALANIVPSTPGRTALVIGNERYPHNPLSSAANDARAMAALLTQAGLAQIPKPADAPLAMSPEASATGLDCPSSSPRCW